jgi:hypothetical protein
MAMLSFVECSWWAQTGGYGGLSLRSTQGGLFFRAEASAVLSSAGRDDPGADSAVASAASTTLPVVSGGKSDEDAMNLRCPRPNSPECREAAARGIEALRAPSTWGMPINRSRAVRLRGCRDGAARSYE